MRRIIGIDLDNTLCVGQHWRPGADVLKAKPIQKAIDKVNKLYIDNFIIIYTARQNFLISDTLEWLNKHDVRFHAISNRKIPLEGLMGDVERIE